MSFIECVVMFLRYNKLFLSQAINLQPDESNNRVYADFIKNIPKNIIENIPKNIPKDLDGFGYYLGVRL
ncbi:hypothetical protein [Helicobacter pylori]|uniref:hypothetical protein n=1 Tax=Helicobacter pylori TaxID=210 RepID=UPI001E4F9AE2|nr:hypothetical protein [Helicobacter pylori]